MYCLFCVVLCIVCFVSFSVLFVCICVLNYCHRLATQLQLNTEKSVDFFGVCVLYSVRDVILVYPTLSLDAFLRYR
jgi:hypothetical protein